MGKSSFNLIANFEIYNFQFGMGSKHFKFLHEIVQSDEMKE